MWCGCWIEPFHPKGKGAGRPPIGLEWMLRMDMAQQCFGLLDEGIEAALYGGVPAGLPDAFERIRARLRVQVEHLFHVIKNLFRHRKTPHRGLARNTAQLRTLLGWPTW